LPLREIVAFGAFCGKQFRVENGCGFKERKKARKKERKPACWESGNLPKKQAASHFPTGPTTGGLFIPEKRNFLKNAKEELSIKR